jgi:hypothetical protein
MMTYCGQQNLSTLVLTHCDDKMNRNGKIVKVQGSPEQPKFFLHFLWVVYN